MERLVSTVGNEEMKGKILSEVWFRNLFHLI
jgi:hypothetical protein